MGVPSNGWSIRENSIEMDDLGVPPFMETPMLVPMPNFEPVLWMKLEGQPVFLGHVCLFN